MSCTWQLKGEGAANLVYAYCGDEPRRRGQVLRVRKPSAHVASAVDRVLWDGILDIASSHGIHYEIEYVANLMAPFLGREYVFPGVPIPTPLELQPDGATAVAASLLPALVLPDNTTFHFRAAPGYKGVGPAICLEIKPKWGLDPIQHSIAPGGCQLKRPPRAITTAAAKHATAADVATVATSVAVAAASSAADSSSSSPRREAKEAVPAAAAAEGMCVGRQRLMSGCIFLGADTDMDLRRRYPRFMLHMLYKHVNYGVPISSYNPLELFSGQLERMEGALRCLIKSPSNNLTVFMNGTKIYGAAHPDPITLPGQRINSQRESRLRPPQQSSPPPPLRDLQPRLHLPPQPLPDCHPQLPLPQPQAQPPPQQRSDVMATLDRLAADLQGFVDDNDPPPQPLPAPTNGGLGHSALDALVRLAAIALQQEGVLSRLQEVQAMDRIGPEGALRLYEQLLLLLRRQGELQAETNQQVTTAASGPSTIAAAAVTAGLATVAAQPMVVVSSDGGGGGERGFDGQGGLVAAVAEVRPPHVDPLADALRRYLMSATAKDCGVMVTLQRVIPIATGGAAQTDAEQEAEGDGAAPHSDVQARSGGGGLQQQQQPRRSRPEPEAGPAAGYGGSAAEAWGVVQLPRVRVLMDPLSSSAYMYKVAFVDLDLKAAAKIPKHVELERALVACAEENLELLQALAQQAGWTA